MVGVFEGENLAGDFAQGCLVEPTDAEAKSEDEEAQRGEEAAATRGRFVGEPPGQKVGDSRAGGGAEDAGADQR